MRPLEGDEEEEEEEEEEEKRSNSCTHGLLQIVLLKRD